MALPADNNLGISVKHFKRKAKLAVRLIKPFSLTPPAAVFFLFHTVEEEKTLWTHGHRYVTPFQIFKKQIEFIHKNFTIAPSSVILQRLREGGMDRNMAAIHFDDGFSSYADLALPFLQKQKLSSTVFLINSVIDGDIPIRNKIAFCINTGEKRRLQELIQAHISRNMEHKIDLTSMPAAQFLSWMKNNITVEMESIINDLYASCSSPEKGSSPFMDEKAVLKLKKNPYVEIGSHTINHPMLSMLDENEQRKEIIDGHRTLEKLFDCRLNYFAYPHGGTTHFNDTSRSIIKESERLVSFSSYGGINYELDSTDVKRITLSDHTPMDTKIAVLKCVA